ncbi:DUF262 domain-containing protein [Mesorhizobium sp. M0587]|uniref:DUF262 domain-containing protein n=1 Tax=Mesorhizobium sp. M0587 TaxID=2956964 RepID=UPI003337A2F6
MERLFANYRDRQFLVNRSYQRKLVWTLDEKQFFVDSISNRYPVPIILLAEKSSKDAKGYEIIDGLQRLNFIF